MFRPEWVPSTLASAIRPGSLEVLRARDPVGGLVPTQDFFRPSFPVGSAAATGVPALFRIFR